MNKGALTGPLIFYQPMRHQPKTKSLIIKFVTKVSIIFQIAK